MNGVQLEAGVNYLNCAYLAPQLGEVRTAAEKALAGLARPWELTPEDFFGPCNSLRTLGARLVGARPRDMALIPSVSFGITTASHLLPVEKGERILVLAEQFPSNYYPWERIASERGARVEVVPSGPSWTEGILARLEDSVAVVAVPAVHWTDCSRVDLVKVGEAARAVGAALVVDGTQSIGASPLNVQEVQPDFVVWALYKWCFGPYGTTLLYVHPKWQGGRPLDENWINRRNSQNFAELVNYTSEYTEGAARFDVGERSQFLLVPMAIAALTQILSWGPDTIESHNGELTDLLAEWATDRGAGVAADRGKHFIGVDLGGGVGDLAARLKEEGIYVSVRGPRLRVAPHLHSSKKDIRQLIETVDRFLPA